MSRLEKARDEKQKNKKRSSVIIFIMLGVMIIGGLLLLPDLGIFAGVSQDPGANLIDLEKSRVFIDIFELTYVRVYVDKDEAVLEILANEEPLEYNAEHDRWEVVLGGFKAGDELTITAVSGDDEEDKIVQEVVLIINEL